jgi:hypothetical protein
MIQKAEDLREVCRKIRHVVKPGHASGLQTVLVLVDHPDPKKATVWKTIDDPQKVVAALKARNKKHFRQAAGNHSPQENLEVSYSTGLAPSRTQSLMEHENQLTQ